jgi:hypothetical protein
VVRPAQTAQDAGKGALYRASSKTWVKSQGARSERALSHLFERRQENLSPPPPHLAAFILPSLSVGRELSIIGGSVLDSIQR